MRVITRRVGEWLSALRPYGILAVAWILFLLYAHPGLMSMDSFDQLEEARAHFYTDSHPPVMAAVWSVVDRIVAGPFGMLAIQSVAFLGGLYLLLGRVMGQTAAAICASALFLFPPVGAPMIVIWKDCLMAGCLLLGVAGIIDSRRWVRVAGLVALFLATALRYNALAATLPLVVILFEWRPGQRWLVRYAIAAGVWLAISVLALGFNAALTDRKMYFWYSTFALADIAGTLANVDDTIPDDKLGPLLAPTQVMIDRDYHEQLRAKYRPDTFTELIGEAAPFWSVPIRGTEPAPVAQREAIGKAWWDIVSSHPGSYLVYRLQVFYEVLGLGEEWNSSVVMRRHWQTPERLQTMGIERYTSRLQKRVERTLFLLGRDTNLFRPWIYVLLSLVLLGFCRRQRLVFAVLVSGLMMELSLLALSATPDFRYSHWMVVCTCLSVVMLIAHRVREARDIARGSEPCASS